MLGLLMQVVMPCTVVYTGVPWTVDYAVVIYAAWMWRLVVCVVGLNGRGQTLHAVTGIFVSVVGGMG